MVQFIVNNKVAFQKLLPNCEDFILERENAISQAKKICFNLKKSS